MILEDVQKMVTEFHKLLGHSISKEPHMLDGNYFGKIVVWMREELIELDNADNLVEQADVLTDLIYFAIGLFVEMGIDASKIFEIVHKANMKKVDDGGVYEDSGKIIKPKDWISPEKEIAIEIKRQREKKKEFDKTTRDMMKKNKEKLIKDMNDFMRRL